MEKGQMPLGESFNKVPSRPPYIRQHPIWAILVIALVLLIIFLVIGHFTRSKKASERHREAKPVSIVTAISRSGDVPIYISALGAVTATYTVTVKTQINGRLQQVLYREGQDVKAGELLAMIDERPYQAQLVQFEGQLLRDQASLANAQLDLRRYARLYPSGAVSKQVYDTQKALVKQNQGNVKFDEGQIQTVKVNIIYCRITSPINGRVGLRLVDPGNFVQTSDANGLVVINTINPINVVFSIPEDNVPQVMQQLSSTKQPLLVKAYDRDQNKLLAVGKFLTIDNQIDPTTGTVKIKAQFQNNDYRLFPDQFVNVQLLVNTLHNVTIVPTPAVQHGSQGTFVYLLKDDHTVSVVPVDVGVTSGSDTVITKGVIPGQAVVVQGSDKLVDGAKVMIVKPITKASPSSRTPASLMQASARSHRSGV